MGESLMANILLYVFTFIFIEIIYVIIIWDHTILDSIIFEYTNHTMLFIQISLFYILKQNDKFTYNARVTN